MPLTLLKSAQWHNEPADWSFTNHTLCFTCSPKSDFWQKTYYGFTPDSGHFLGYEVSGDFCATLEFSGDFDVLYDQIGLMLRADASRWIKSGIEFSDDVTNFSTVVTRQRSDWSVIPQPELPDKQAVRLTRVGSAVLTHCRTPDGRWQMMRLADFEAPERAFVGPVACSPLREVGQPGFRASIHSFAVDPVPQDPLHGMSD